MLEDSVGIVINYRGTAGKPPGGWGFFFTFQMRLAQKKTPGRVSTYFNFIMHCKPEVIDKRARKRSKVQQSITIVYCSLTSLLNIPIN